MSLSFLFDLLRRSRQQLFQIFVMLVMLAIGLWGHHSHWQFSSHAQANTPGHGAGHAAGAKAAAVLGPAPDASAQPGSDQAPVITFQSAEAVGQLGVKTMLARRRPVACNLSAAGVVTYEPTRRAQIATRAVGTVWRVEKQVGQAIRAGDVLAIIDAPAVGDAKAAFLHAVADVQLCQKTYERLQSLTAGEVPHRQVQEAENAVRKARVDLFNSQQSLISLGLPVDRDEWLALSEDDLQKRIKFLGLPASVVSDLDPNATTASLLPLLAPFDGVVIGRELSKGEVVSPEQGHFEIADVSRMWIVLNVRERDVSELALGQQVDFKSGSAQASGKIAWMSTAVDEKTRTVEVRCETENPLVVAVDGKSTGQRLLRANMFGVGTIQVRQTDNAVVVPTRSIQRRADEPVVFVQVSPKGFSPRPVRLGVVTSEYTEILAGLSPSETIVDQGSHILKAELQRLSGTNSQ
ncbi:MAG: efflux RND transporter periplasmic adaptor subunit [Pirellulales bacterium]